MAKRRKHGRASVRIEPLETRTLLSTFSNAGLNGTLNLSAMSVTGTIVADGNGNFTGGSFTHDDGSVSTPNGTYSLASNGALTASVTTTSIGGMNSSKNVAPVSGTSLNSLGVLVSTGSATFSTADLTGTWYLFDNGDSGPPDDYPGGEADNSGHATVSFDGNGGFIYTHSNDESGTSETGAGTYTVTSAGAVNMAITTSSNPGNGPLPNFTGTMNSSKDFAGMTETNLPLAASTDNDRLIVMVKPSGVYSDTDLQGTWTFCNDTGYGTFTFDSTGNISGSYTTSNSSGGGLETVSVTGPYSFSADGSFTATPTATGQTVPVVQISGWMNASRNVLVYDKPNSGAEGLDDMSIEVNSGTPLGATVSLQSSSGSISPGQSVTLTATVAPVLGSNNTLGGSVNFFDGATIIGSAPVQPDGTASITSTSLLSGINSVTAAYTGDPAFAAVTSSSVSVVNSVPKTIGQLDPTFGTQGLASHDTGFTSTNGIAADGTQSIIIGTDGTAPDENFGITRYNADGSLDTAFGTGGIVDTSFSGTDDLAASVDVLANGQFLVAGTATTYSSGVAAGSEFAIAEYNADGSLNTGFGGGTGEVLVTFSSTGSLSSDVLTSLIVNPSGVIYLGGSSDAGDSGTSDFAIAALNADGSLDTGFGSGGKLTQSFGAGSDFINTLALQANGDIVAAGSAAIGGVTEVALARFLPAGALDPRFGSKGLVTTNVRGVFDSASSILIDPKGKIDIGGLSATGSGSSLSSDFLLARYSAAGKLDPTFGSGGITTTNFGQPSAVTKLVLQANGEIVASGKTTSSLTNTASGNLEVALARYTPAGAPDTTFNGNGKTIIDLSGATAGTTGSHTLLFSESILQPLDASNDQALLNQLISSKQGIVVVTPGGGILIAGNNGTDTVEAKVITAGVDLVASLLSQPPSAIIGGAKGAVSVQIVESGTDTAAGTVTIVIEIAADPQGDAATSVKSLPEKISLRQQQRRSYKITFVFPTNLNAGSYYLVANVQNGSAAALQNLNPQDELTASKTTVAISPPTITLQGTGLSAASTFVPGKVSRVIFTLSNQGNVPAKGTTTVELFLSTDPSANGGMITSLRLPVGLSAGKNRVSHLSFVLPVSVTAGSYYLIAVIDPVDSLGSIDHSDSMIVDGTQLVVN